MPPKSLKPQNFDEALALSGRPADANRLIRGRLLELLFTQDAAVAVRAAEMYLSMGAEGVDDEFADVPTDVLMQLRSETRDWLRQKTGDSAAWDPRTDD